MNSSHDSHENWSPCRGGEIGRLVDRLNRRRRRHRMGRTAGAATLLLVAAALGYSVSGLGPTEPEPALAEMNCRQVRQNADEYVAGELDRETEERVRLHLADCPSCEEHVEETRRKSQPAARDGDPDNEATGQRDAADRPRVARLSHSRGERVRMVRVSADG